MSVPRFDIVLDNIRARFVPGDVVKGTVLFDITGERFVGFKSFLHATSESCRF